VQKKLFCSGLAKTRVFLKKSPARWVFLGFYWVLLGFIGVLLGFIGFFRFYWVFLNFRPNKSIFLPVFGLFLYLLADEFKNKVNESIIINKLWLPVKNL
jgi:hypothetical protein